jgi:hypothetical protein
MDEETERLRDIFREVTGEETATERQRADRGSLLDEADTGRLREVVAGMRAELGFDTDLDDGTLAAVVERFYDGEDDAAIAAALGITEHETFRARTDLHLLRDGDADPQVLAAVREARRRQEPAEDEPVERGGVLAGADPEAVERAERVARAERRARRTSERFRTAFEELLTDADLRGPVIGDARADGLREAAEDIDPETDVDF